MQEPPEGNFVDFRDVWLAYNDELLTQNHFALEAIDLTVREGEFIAIVGPSGCCKKSASAATRTSSRGSCRAACSSAWRWPLPDWW